MKDTLELFCPRCGGATQLKWYPAAPLVSYTCHSCRTELALPPPLPAAVMPSRVLATLP